MPQGRFEYTVLDEVYLDSHSLMTAYALKNDDDVLVAGEQFRVGAQLKQQLFAYLVLRLIVEESESPHRTGGRAPG